MSLFAKNDKEIFPAIEEHFSATGRRKEEEEFFARCAGISRCSEKSKECRQCYYV